MSWGANPCYGEEEAGGVGMESREKRAPTPKPLPQPLPTYPHANLKGSRGQPLTNTHVRCRHRGLGQGEVWAWDLALFRERREKRRDVFVFGPVVVLGQCVVGLYTQSWGSNPCRGEGEAGGERTERE